MAQSNQTRDTRLDAIRGLLLVVMSIDHFPSALQPYTYQSLGFVSAAEGFVFLSGYVAGLSYARTMVQGGMDLVRQRAIRRARSIYLLHVCTFLFGFFAMGFLERDSTWQGTWGLRYESPFTAMLMGAMLLYQPQYDLDILPMYCVFVLAIPLLAAQLKRQRFAIILYASAFVWVMAQTGLGTTLVDFLHQYAPVDFGTFDILAWQFLFIGGFVFGYYRTDQGKPIIQLGPKSLAGISLLAILFYLFRHELIPCSEQLKDDMLTGRHLLSPLRLVNFGLIAVLISRPFLWPRDQFWTRALSLLGRNSLTVFSFHLVLVYAVSCFVLSRVEVDESGKTFLAIAIIALLFATAWVAESANRRKRAVRGSVVLGG